MWLFEKAWRKCEEDFVYLLKNLIKYAKCRIFWESFDNLNRASYSLALLKNGSWLRMAFLLKFESLNFNRLQNRLFSFSSLYGLHLYKVIWGITYFILAQLSDWSANHKLWFIKHYVQLFVKETISKSHSISKNCQFFNYKKHNV